MTGELIHMPLEKIIPKGNSMAFPELSFEPNLLLYISLTLVLAFLGSKIFQRFGIPQVVGFLVVGVLLGNSGINLIPLELVNDLTIISLIALGLIGFDMGSHLRFDELRKLGRSITVILLFEAFGTFLLVTTGVYLITRSSYTSLIFGALASATAPAATVDVLAEYDAKGPLTTSLIAVVGLDDALALLLYSLSATLATSLLTGQGGLNLAELVVLPVFEIGGSVLLGVLLGLMLDFILVRLESHHDAMAISIGFVLLCVALSEGLGFSLILSNMVLGTVLTNRDPAHARRIRYTVEQAGPVIYVLFFALVGARFQVSYLPAMGLLGIAYIALRSFGKFGGAWLGGHIGGAVPAVRDNLGFGLLSQAGVAMGLAIASSERFSDCGEAGIALGVLIINVICATTFVVQVIGPIFVKFAIRRADEIGKAKLGPEVWASEGTPE
jgi:Kef-type K+ transport system membrane component KefB